VDAAYEARLAAYLGAPRPRRSLLQGVWVIFGLKQAYDALSVALLHAGSQVHLLCTTEVQANKVAEDLKRSAAVHRAPREVWLVPGVEQRVGALLAAPLRELGARCLTVTHGAVVAGILAGTLDAVHAEATPFGCQDGPAAGASFPGTQQQPSQPPPMLATLAGQRAPQWSNIGRGTVGKAVKEEEESFPHTQQQQYQQQPPRPGQVRPAAARAPREPVPQHMPPPLADAVKRPSPDRGGAPEEPVRPSVRRRTLPSAEETRALVAGDTAKEQVQARGASRVELGLGGGAAGSSGHTKLEGDARTGPPSQPSGVATKPEPGKVHEALAPDRPPPQSLVSSIVLSQPKREPADVAEPSLKFEPVHNVEPSFAKRLVEGSEARQGRAVPLVEISNTAKVDRDEGKAVEPGMGSELTPAPVKHPTGVWLQSLRSEQVEPPLQENRSIITDVPQAPWSPDAEVMLRSPNAASARGQATPKGEAARTTRRNFKAFRKALGQVPRVRDPVVQVAPWVPEAGPALAELFCSQHFDSQSQMPPVLI